jgi:hypothetical protein
VTTLHCGKLSSVMVRGLCAGLVLTLASGCVGVPFGLPPTQLTVASGVEVANGRAEPPLQIRAAVHPMQFAPDWTARDVDFGVGYMLDATRSYTLHGGYAEGGAVLWKHMGRTSFQRLSARAQVRVLKDPDQPLVGRGAAALLVLETGKFVDGPFTDFDSKGGVLGYSFGESSIGFASELSYASVDRLQTWALTLGLVVRVPTVVGFAFVWATELLKK